MKKLLIADDEEGVRALVRMTLDRADYEILEASNGDDALELARTQHPELILLDVEMPRRSGLDVCRALKADTTTAGATVVMLTARSQQTDLTAGHAAGADGYFTKPFSPSALLGKVEEILGPNGGGP
ncbi:MAG TPA: response regulator [Actinomycetota bacterium]|nr:response regulator [Actinomycetota bacterium]